MRSPLTVRISDGVRDQHVTRFVKGLRFTKTAPGGHHSASVQMEVPDSLLGGLGPADRLYIYDGRKTRTVWDGYVENPGRTAVLGGGRYDLSALGGVVLAADNARAVAFRSTGLSHNHWTKTGDVTSAQADVDEAIIGVPAIKLQFQPGSPVGSLAYAAMLNRILEATGQPLRAVRSLTRAGKTDADWAFSIDMRNADGSFHSGTTLGTFSTSDVAHNAYEHLGDFTFGGVDKFAVVAVRTGGATTVADDETWSTFRDVVVIPGLKDKTGAYTGIGGAPSAYVLAHEVVAHVVGDMLPLIDGPSAQIDSTSFLIDHLAYLEGAKPQQVLDDLSLYEPDHLWEILETSPSGKHRFAYRAWPTTPRYEISGREFTESGGEVDLCNRIAVSWKDETGADQVTVRTASVPDLGSRIKDAEPVTLPDGQGSLANAQRIGDEVLAALNTPTRSGTAVVRQPIQDKLTGMMVMPWELQPGYLVRVRDIGVDLRMTEMTYDDTNCSASLSLGTPVLTQAQRIARLRR